MLTFTESFNESIQHMNGDERIHQNTSQAFVHDKTQSSGQCLPNTRQGVANEMENDKDTAKNTTIPADFVQNKSHHHSNNLHSLAMKSHESIKELTQPSQTEQQDKINKLDEDIHLAHRNRSCVSTTLMPNKDLRPKQLSRHNDNLNFHDKHIQFSETKLKDALLETQQELEAQNNKYKELLKEEKTRNDELLELKAKLLTKEDEFKRVVEAREQIFEDLTNMRLVEQDIILRISKEQEQRSIEHNQYSATNSGQTMNRKDAFGSLIENIILDNISDTETDNPQKLSQSKPKCSFQTPQMVTNVPMSDTNTSMQHIPINQNTNRKENQHLPSKPNVIRSKPKTAYKQKMFRYPITRKLRKSKEAKSKATQLAKRKRSMKQVYSDEGLSTDLDDMPPLEPKAHAMNALYSNQSVQPMSHNVLSLKPNKIVPTGCGANRPSNIPLHSEINSNSNQSTNRPVVLERQPLSHQNENIRRVFAPMPIPNDTIAGPHTSTNSSSNLPKQALIQESNPNTNTEMTGMNKQIKQKQGPVLSYNMVIQHESKPQPHKADPCNNSQSSNQTCAPSHFDNTMKQTTVCQNSSIPNNHNNIANGNVSGTFSWSGHNKSVEPKQTPSHGIHERNDHGQLRISHPGKRPHDQVKQTYSMKQLQTRLKKERSFMKGRGNPIQLNNYSWFERKQSQCDTISAKEPSSHIYSPSTVPPERPPLLANGNRTYGLGTPFTSVPSHSISQSTSCQTEGSTLLTQTLPSSSNNSPENGFQTESKQHKHSVEEIANRQCYIENLLNMFPVTRHPSQNPNGCTEARNSEATKGRDFNGIPTSQIATNPNKVVESRQVYPKSQANDKLNTCDALEAFHRLRHASHLPYQLNREQFSNGNTGQTLHSTTEGLKHTSIGTDSLKAHQSQANLHGQRSPTNTCPKTSQSAISSKSNSSNVRPSGHDNQAGVTCAVCHDTAKFLCSACMQTPYCSQPCQVH